MSTLNVFITPTVGLIGVDSEATKANGQVIERVERGKLVVAPLANAAVGFRGKDHLLHTLTPRIVSCGVEFDQLAADLPGYLKESIDFCVKESLVTEEELKIDVALVGYSPAERCVVGYLFTREVGSDEIGVNRISGSYMAPYWSGNEIPDVTQLDRQEMIQTALRQTQLARERAPDFASGGRFIIAEVRQSYMTIDKAFDFPSR